MLAPTRADQQHAHCSLVVRENPATLFHSRGMPASLDPGAWEAHLSVMADLLTNAAEFTVSEIAAELKRTVEDSFGNVRVRGEISGFRGQHSSGHCYFTLKDEGACIDAVIWKTSFPRLRFKPEEGLEVIATGRLTTYPRSSKYQIVIEQIEPAGAGALMALLEERRKRLLAEGLFDVARKRRIPFLPLVIGVVTSPTGAVIRDILHRLEDRFPTHVLVWPVRVQGETCAEEVTAAIEGFNRLPVGGPIARPDLLIVARGGGSIEDLWGFNEESVVRAVANSTIPVISAVGHETDTTLCDHAADHRAPTPTAAAEAAVPVHNELVLRIDELGLRQRGAALRLAGNGRDRLRAAGRGLPRPADLLSLARQRLDHAGSNLLGGLRRASNAKSLAYNKVAPRLSPATLRNELRHARMHLTPLLSRMRLAEARSIADRRGQLEQASKLLGTVSYKSVLARGFALVTDATGRLIRGSAQVQPGEPISIELAADDRIAATVAGSSAPARRRVRVPATKEQESLF